MHHTTAVLALALVSGTAAADSITKTSTAPTTPSTLEISAGAYRDTRSLLISAENPEGVTQYVGVPTHGVSFELAAYPLQVKHANGWRSSFGVSGGLSRSVGAKVAFLEEDGVADIGIDQLAWNAAAHHRLTAGRFTLDTHAGLGQSRYGFDDAPAELEVPDTRFTYLAVGTHAALDVYKGITLGAGGQLVRGIGDAGDLNSMEFYGPGSTSGLSLDASLTVPLPKGTFVRARVTASKLVTQFDGVGAITEMEGVTRSEDTTASAGVSFGIRR